MPDTLEPKKKTSPWLIGCLGLVGVFILLAIIGSFLPKTPETPTQTITSSTTQEAPKIVTPAAKQYVQIYTLKGKGNRDTESFQTSGGNLKMTATASGSSQGSFSGVTLKSESGGYLSGAELMLSTDNAKPATGETIIRNADAGKYYISVISGVDWTVQVFEEK